MVGKTEFILSCLVAVGLLALAARKIRIPYPILLTVGGLVLALVPGVPAIRLEPDNTLGRKRLAFCLNELAWALATHAGPARRDPVRVSHDGERPRHV